MLTSDQVIKAFNAYRKSQGVHEIGPIQTANIQTNLPKIITALQKYEILSDEVLIGAVATIGTETPYFAPIIEEGNAAYFTKHYENRADLGNNQKGDGAKFPGRGFVQTTGRFNYAALGTAVGKDLLTNPELALDPDIAAEGLALFFRDHKVVQQCNAKKWSAARYRVNGGYNGEAKFLALVDELIAAQAA